MGLIEEKQLSKYGQMVQFSEFIDFMVCYTNERDFDVANYLFESQEFCRLDFYTIESDGFTKTTYAEDIAGDEEGRGTISSFLYDVSIGDTLRDYYFYYWRIEDILAVTEIKFLELDLDKYKQYCYASSLHASSVIQIIEENSKLKGNQSDLINAETSKELQLIVDSQAKQIADLKAKIAELEAGKASQSDTPADDKELSPVSQKAVTKLLYALFIEHGYQLDGARKGATNDQIANLTKRHKVGINRDTIANWLDRTNELHHDKTKQ